MWQARIWRCDRDLNRPQGGGGILGVDLAVFASNPANVMRTQQAPQHIDGVVYPHVAASEGAGLQQQDAHALPSQTAARLSRLRRRLYRCDKAPTPACCRRRCDSPLPGGRAADPPFRRQALPGTGPADGRAGRRSRGTSVCHSMACSRRR